MTTRLQTYLVQAATAFFGLVIMAQAANAQELVVRLAFDQVFDRILPFPKMTTAHKEIEVRINGKGEIRSKRDSVTGSRSEFASHDVENLKLGSNQRQEWRVVGKDTLIYIVEYPTFREAILLTVSGSACNAEVDFELKPGFTEYRYTRINGDPAVARSAMATRLTCAVSQP